MCSVAWGGGGGAQSRGEYHEYRGDIMIHVEGYHEYCGVFSAVEVLK